MSGLLPISVGYGEQVRLFVFSGFVRQDLCSSRRQRLRTSNASSQWSDPNGRFKDRESNCQRSEFCGIRHQSLVLRLHAPKYATQSLQDSVAVARKSQLIALEIRTRKQKMY